MRSRLLLAAAATAGVLLAGCASPSAIHDAGPSASVSASPEASNIAEPVPATVVVSLDDVTLLNDDESVAGQAPFSDGAAILALLGTAFGSTPAGEIDEHFQLTSYRWNGVRLITHDWDGSGWMLIEVAEVSGVNLVTTDGIAIGDTRTAVEAVAGFDPQLDQDGDGKSDLLGLQPRPFPGAQSLYVIGEPGTEFVEIDFTGDLVTAIRTPSSDFHDV
jgi:hypothetical protein